MPALVLFLICILFLPGALGIAQAESSFELRKKRGFFVYEDFRQWVDLKYRFTDHDFSEDKESRSVSHAFQESYNFALNAAIYDPHIFDASLQAGLVFDQSHGNTGTSSDSSNENGYTYNFSGLGLDRSPTPFTVRSFRETTTIESTYTLPYTTDNTGNEFDVSLRNKLLLSRFHFARNTLDTTGAGFDNSSVTHSYSYSGENSYKDFSSTTLGWSFSDSSSHGSTGGNQEARYYTLEFTNSLLLGEQKNSSLFTTFRWDDSNTGGIPQRDMTFSEIFQSSLGRALELKATYTLDDSSSSGFAGQNQDNTLNFGEVTLKHRLFKSLETTLLGRVSLNKINGGNEDKYAGSVAVRYNKLLPADSRLAIGMFREYEVVDRQLGSASTSVIDEPHPGVHQGDAIDLRLGGGTLNSVVSVKSRNPLFTYVEGIDYTVNLALGRIDILAGGGVRIDLSGTGTDLYISYVYSKDPVVKYANDSLSVDSELSLFKDIIQFGAAFISARQTLISGPVTNSLQDTRSMTLYVSGRYDIFNYRLSYRDVTSGNQAYQSLEGMGRAAWNTSNSSVTLMARDRYNKYDANSSSVGYSENSAELSALYQRNILSYMRLNVQANVIDLRSDLRDTKDTLSLLASYSIQMNKTAIIMSGQTVWSFYNGGTTRDDSFHLDITRYF